MNGNSHVYGEIEIGLHRLQVDAHEVELRISDPASAGEIEPRKGYAHISLGELQGLRLNPAEYGQRLTDQLFQDAAVREFYRTNKATFESRGIDIRLRLLIGRSAPELHSIRWELLLDPDTRQPLATSERIVFSRFMFGQDYRQISLPRKSELRALIAVAAPNDTAKWGLAQVDRPGEIARARGALAGLKVTVIGDDAPLTSSCLIEAIRKGSNIVYLVCHGALPQERPACLYLQDEQGNAVPVAAGDLAQQIAELKAPPCLFVLASCESASAEGSSDAHAALAPHLAAAGVPAVVAMQGKITMETVRKAMPVFFRELVKDGRIDRAMAVARGEVRGRPDSWMPALFLRLKRGVIWYEPGFKAEFNKWPTICNAIRKGMFVPILGPELGEEIFGGTSELAGRLGSKHAFPLAPYERADLAKVAQYIATDQDLPYAREQVEKYFKQRLIAWLDGNSQAIAGNELPELLDMAGKRCQENPENPYRMLADLRAPIYVNASCETLFLRVLRNHGAQPDELSAAWRSGEGREVPKQPRPKSATPTAERPWVYHVFGLFERPDSMVLTEDDFFDYLIATAKSDLLLPALMGRLMQSSLLFLGFRLDDWRFRVLFRMIATRQGRGTLDSLSHVGVQVNPDEQNLLDVERTRKYIESYFGSPKDAPRISIYWGKPAEFLKELQEQRQRENPEEPQLAKGKANEW